MSINYQTLLDKLEIKIEEYRNTLLKISVEDEHHYNYDIMYKNERSIAAFITYVFPEILTDLSFENIKVVNEFSIKTKQILTQSQGQAIDDAIPSNQLVNVNKQKFYPDSFLSFRNNGGTQYNVFVEYKVNSHFSYYDMANDFVKFMQYSTNARVNPIFMFMILNPVNNGLEMSLLKTGQTVPKFQILKPRVIRNQIDIEASVFIFCPDIANHNSIDPTDGIDPDQILFISNSLTEETNKLIELDWADRYDMITNYDDDIYLSNHTKFGSRVLFSKRIRETYNQIKILYTYLQDNQHVVELSNDSFIQLTDFIADINLPIEFIDDLSQYFKNHIRHFTDDERSGTNAAMFSSSNKKSLWIQMIIQKFAVSLGVDVLVTNFKSEKEEEDSAEVLDILENAYRGSAINKFNKLAVGLIYFIVKLYESKYDIIENRLQEKTVYLAFNIKKNIIKEINNFKKHLRLRGRIDWDDNLETEAINIMEELIYKLMLQTS